MPKLLWRLARLIFTTHLLFISNPPAIKTAYKISSQSQGILLSWETGPTHPWSTCYLCNETPSPFLRLSHSWTLSLKVSSRCLWYGVLVMVMTTDPSLEQFHEHFRDNGSLSRQENLQPAQFTAGPFLVSMVLPYMLKFFSICIQILALPLEVQPWASLWLCSQWPTALAQHCWEGLGYS